MEGPEAAAVRRRRRLRLDPRRYRFAVLKDKPNTTAGVDLVKQTYLTKEGQLLRFKTAGYLPTMKSLYTDPDFTNYEEPYLGGQKIMAVYQGIPEAAPPYYQNANLPVL